MGPRRSVVVPALGRPRLVYVTTVAATQWAFLRGQNRFMARRGFELHAIASPGIDLERLRARDGVAIHPVTISRAITPLRDLVSLVRLYRLLRKVKPVILHVSTSKAALLGGLAGWAAGVPCRIYFVRGLFSEGAVGYRRIFYRGLERLTAALCHRTICVSRSLLEFARGEGIAGPSATVPANGMSNGIDARRFPAHDALVAGSKLRTSDQNTHASCCVLGFVGRLTRDKGVEDLAEAWDRLRRDYPLARLLLVGPWDGHDAISSSWRGRLERDEKVELTGPVSDVVPFYRRMSVFVYPSHGGEGLPNAPVEAAAVGLPVIATRVVGCVDAVVDGTTGTLVEKGDVTALIAALRRYIEDPRLRVRHGRAGRERALREFRQEPIWEATYAEYLSILREMGQPSPSGPTRIPDVGWTPRTSEQGSQADSMAG